MSVQVKFGEGALWAIRACEDFSPGKAFGCFAVLWEILQAFGSEASDGVRFELGGPRTRGPNGDPKQ